MDDTTSTKCVCPLKITEKSNIPPPKVLPLPLLFLFCSVGYRHSSKKNTFFPRPPQTKYGKTRPFLFFVLKFGRGGQEEGHVHTQPAKKEERKKRLVASPPPIREGNKNRMCSQRPAVAMNQRKKIFFTLESQKSFFLKTDLLALDPTLKRSFVIERSHPEENSFGRSQRKKTG